MTNLGKKVLAIIIIILCLIAGFIYYAKTHKKVATPIVVVDPHADLIKVYMPTANAVATNPLAISGVARGNWYFEASFPIKITDANGVVIGSGIATAQGDWMTTDFVPFTASIAFTTPATPTGFVILQKDNPSGEPANDDSISVPVTF